MAEPDVDLKGLLERNTPGLGHTISYRLDNVTIEVDLSAAWTKAWPKACR
jgi:hypothetical protein